MTFKGTLNHAPIKILIDSGAMGNFVSKQATDRFSFALSDVSNIPVVFANGATGACNKAALAAYLRFENHEEKIDLRVVSLPHHDIILGQPWLEKWNPNIDWKNHKINFTSANLEYPLPVKKTEETAILPERKTSSAAGYDLTPAEEFTLQPGEQRLINTGIAMAIPEGYYGQLHPRSSAAKIELSVEGGVIDSDYRGPIKIILRNQGNTPYTFKTGDPPVAQMVLLKITTPPVQEVQNLENTTRNGGFGSTNISFISIDSLIQTAQEEDQYYLCSITEEGDVTYTNAQDPRVKPILENFPDVFPTELPPGLPPSRNIDHRIELEPGSKPPWRPIYRMSPLELDAMRAELDRLLETGSIEPSLSPYGAPVIFVKKKDGKLRMCIDYRALNKITKKNRFPIPLIDDLIDRLQGASTFTKIDLRWGYHQVRIHQDDVEKTAFRTRYGHYQYKVMPFGLTNAPATFQALVQDILKPLLDVCVIVYIDDILIYSQNEEEHKQHIHQVLEILRKHKMYGNMAKCEFFKESVEYLGHVISSKGISTDPKKVESIKHWPVPANLKEMQSFLGLCNYYRRFIESYSKIAAPLTDLTHKDVPFIWTSQATEAFKELKKRMTEAPVLCIPDPDLPFTVTTDASDFAVGAVLTQDQGQGPQPVAFTSRKMNSHERNYAAHEKETLAIMHALVKWRVYLEGRHFTIFTDHATLRHFPDQPNLSRRQARWTEKMADYDFKIEYLPGKQNVVADAISRRPDLQLNSVFRIVHDFKAQVKDSIINDPDFEDILKTLRNLPVKKRSPSSLLAHYSTDQEDNLYYDQDRLCIPRGKLRTQILHDHHDAPIAGHQGIERTYATIHRMFYWPRMNNDIRQYVKSCDSCQRIKASQQVPGGLLQPLPIPTRPWEQVSMDFIVQLPKTKAGFDAIVVFVDTFSKMTHFAPTMTTATAPDTARLFFDHVFRLHGLPTSIVSDRDAKFTSKFWKTLFQTLGTKLAMSTAFHPQTDGQTERANRTLEDMLRAFTSYRQDDWDLQLTAAEFACNNAPNASTGMSPFKINAGRDPLNPYGSLTKIPDHIPASHDFLEEISNATKIAHDALVIAKANQEKNANKSRRDVQFEVDDQVLLSSAHINLASQAKRPSKKLQHRFIGPYRIIQKVSPVAYKLDIPQTLKIHPVFHVSILRPYSDPASITHRPPSIPPPNPISIQDREEFEVERILDHRKQHNHQEYLVKWVGYPDYDASWEPAAHLEHAQDCLTDYWTSRRSLEGGGSDVMVLQTQHSGGGTAGGRGTVDAAQHMPTPDCGTVGGTAPNST